MEHATFDDPKLRWRKGSGINVPVILKFTTRRTEAVNVKERVGQTGINVRFLAKMESVSLRWQQSPGNMHTQSATDTRGDNTDASREDDLLD